MQAGRRSAPRNGFSLPELLVSVGIAAALAAMAAAALPNALEAGGRAAGSMSNLRQLAAANAAYASDNNGRYCPAQEPTNLVRWHGARPSAGAPFDPAKGFLSPYLGHDRRVKTCPLFLHMLRGGQSFEDGSGGYGYNETYIGGTPADPYTPLPVARVPRPARTVMFATTAFAVGGGLQEYPFSEPPQWVDPNYVLSGALQPSTHFRAHGRALVAWCDGHVSAEPPNSLAGANYYGGDNRKDKIGWFGPTQDNGYWNPDYAGP